MKITIITFADIRPDFVELQYSSIKKYVKDDDVEYLVLNNAVNNETRRIAINNACDRIGVKCVLVDLNENYRVSGQAGTFDVINLSYVTGMSACEYPLNWYWEEVCKMDGIVVIIDSDMFFVKNINIEEMMSGKDIAFVPQYRMVLEEFKVFYMWNGIVFLNMDTLPNPEKIDWTSGPINGCPADVGARTHYYFQENIENINCTFLEFWALHEFKINENGIYCFAVLNGNMTYDIFIDNNGNIVKFNNRDAKFSDKKSFPYETEMDDYPKYFVGQFKEFHRLLVKNDINLPEPLYCDLIRIHGSEISDSFIFHYKSGSNWQYFQSEDYNKTKTCELKKIIERGIQ